MKKTGNPYSLLFGKKPTQFISRIEQTETILQAFRAEPSAMQVYMITGVRGSGKTVMMTSIANQLDQEGNWLIVNLNPSRDMLQSMAAKLYKEPIFKPLLAELKVDFSLLGIGVSVAKAEKISDVESAIEILLKIAGKLKKKVLVTIDEVANGIYVQQFISAFQIFLREDFPIFLLMTGLYENIQQLKNHKSLTFLYRAPKIELQPLNINAMKESYRKTLSCSEESARWLAVQTKGYSYAFQVLGYFCWGREETEFATVIPSCKQYLEEYSYEKIWTELSANEQTILRTMAKTETESIKEIRKQIGFDSDKFTVYRTRMIRKGVIVPTSYGHIALALPFFKEFILSQPS